MPQSSSPPQHHPTQKPTQKKNKRARMNTNKNVNSSDPSTIQPAHSETDYTKLFSMLRNIEKGVVDKETDLSLIEMKEKFAVGKRVPISTNRKGYAGYDAFSAGSERLTSNNPSLSSSSSKTKTTTSESKINNEDESSSSPLSSKSLYETLKSNAAKPRRKFNQRPRLAVPLSNNIRFFSKSLPNPRRNQTSGEGVGEETDLYVYSDDESVNEEEEGDEDEDGHDIEENDTDADTGDDKGEGAEGNEDRDGEDEVRDLRCSNAVTLSPPTTTTTPSTTDATTSPLPDNTN